MRLPYRAVLWAAVVLPLSFLPGVGGAQPPASVDGIAIDPEAELVVALTADTTNLDPRLGMGSIRSNYIRQVFESLVDVDRDGKPVPGLAVSWKPVDDLTWEFGLRRNVTFHDGEPFNADTVLFNLDRMFRRNLDKLGIKDVPAGTSFEKVYPFVSRWEKVDDHTVRVHTTEPAPTLWDFLGREPLVPRAWTIKHGVEALNEKPVGTGPWKLVEWKRKDHMRFERHDGYWGTPPLTKRLRLQVIPEAAARLAALRAGQVHLVEAVPPLDAEVLGRDAAVRVVSSVQKLACRIYLNGRTKDKYDSGGRDGAFVDPRVRLALNYAVNRDAIIKKIFHGLALPNASPVATVSYGHAPQAPYPYDPAQARALLAEAGWKATPRGLVNAGGEALTLQLLLPAKHYGQAFDETVTAVVEMLKAVGVQVTVQTLDFGSLLQTLTKGTLPPNGGFAACRTSNNLDGDDYVRDWASTTLVNWTPYPPELLGLYQATRRQVDAKKRLAALADLQRQVRDWAPVVSLYQEKKAYAHSPRVLRFTPTQELNMDFRGVALKR
ncbi:MAG TPA: ABC transporter substrate-binding protein [Methylomirabilota bacterium]|nr:ABC transporter substrate-binding protein [Methylomirabilota bacterium]